METRISINPPQSGIKNMQLDYDNFNSINQPSSNKDCYIRIYEWDKPTISYGIAQKKIIDKVARPEKKDEIDWVERMTGGRMVLHHKEITYSLATSLEHPIFGNTLESSYSTIADILILFLQKLGIKASYRLDQKQLTKTQSLVCYDLAGLGEITINGNKLIGSAQKRGEYAFLQHGSIPFYSHALRLDDYLKKEYLSNNEIQYDFLESHTEKSITETKNLLMSSFEEYFTSL